MSPRFLFPALIAVIAVSVAGCGKRITNSNIEAVNKRLAAWESGTIPSDSRTKGITPKEVESILGQPTRIETFKIPLETQKPLLDGARYYYEQDGQTVEVHFVDNKLISRVPHWEDKAKNIQEQAGK